MRIAHTIAELRAILAAAPRAIEIGDRRRAIETAIAELGAGDMLVIAGKGHETGQIVGDETLPFDDAEIARAIVERRPGVERRPSVRRRTGS